MVIVPHLDILRCDGTPRKEHGSTHLSIMGSLEHIGHDGLVGRQGETVVWLSRRLRNARQYVLGNSLKKVPRYLMGLGVWAGRGKYESVSSIF